MSDVLILGCGPAALFAAHAVEQTGNRPHIVSKKRKSEMFGAQYLHRPIPGVSVGDGFSVQYSLMGSIDVYRDKVYGKGFRGSLSPEDLQESHKAWDIRAAYDVLWAKYQDSIVNTEFESPQHVAGYLAGSVEIYAHIISTIPAHMLCHNPAHVFQSTQVWAIGDAPERGVFSPITSAVNTVVCSGYWEESWYRKSNILGYNTVEWPKDKRPPIEGLAPVIKPIGTNCDCWREVHRLGRYGKWTKGVLSHEAFYETFVGLTPEEGK